MGKAALGVDVVEAGMERLKTLYANPDNRVVVSFSAGKDSGVCLELSIAAAEEEGRLPVEVVMRDEEIMFPGTFEYAERVAARPEVSFHWIVAQQPIINIFNRKDPYWWVFDPLLDPEEWVRQPPAFSEWIDELHIGAMTTIERFTPGPSGDLYSVIGLRTDESPRRASGLHSSGSHITRHRALGGALGVRPIYDWKDGDVWRAIGEFGWDYNSAYDVLVKFGVPRKKLRIAPPTLNRAGVPTLDIAARAWPRWFDRVNRRLPGIRSAAHFGLRAVTPMRRQGEAWSECFRRVCLEEAPAWIADRAQRAADVQTMKHSWHSSEGLPEISLCGKCHVLGSWKALTEAFYGGDPFSTTMIELEPVEPEFFRPGAGSWGGTPQW